MLHELAPWLCSGLLLVTHLLPHVAAQDLSDYQISLVEGRLVAASKLSWELGTRAQAETEAHAPLYSVMSPNALPPPTSIPSNISDAMTTILGIAKGVVSNRGASNGYITGPQPLIKDGAAADPASLGVTVLIANWTGQGAKDNLDYAGAAKDQLDFLLYNVSRTSDGAISHRAFELQLWSDFVYMVPPFMAYYAVLSNNATLLQQSYDQISLYRKYMRDPSANNLWKHVLMGGTNNGDPDPEHWSTGNGWAAAGMLRVLGTIKNSQFNSSFQQQQQDLVNWVLEIQTGMYANIDSTNIFKNWADLKSNSNFYDASSTALMASTVYRLSLLTGVNTHLPSAERSRHALSNSANAFPTLYTTPFSSAPPPTSSSASSSSLGNVSSTTTLSASSSGSISENQTSVTLASRTSTSTTVSSQVISSGSVTASASMFSGNVSSAVPSSASTEAPSPTSMAIPPGPTSTASPLKYLTNEGWLTPVCNPHSFGSEGSQSAEAQAFVVEMQAAWKDWVADGSKGANSAARSGASLVVSLCATLLLVCTFL